MNTDLDLDLTGGTVAVPCAVCGTEVQTAPLFARPERRKHVRCPDHATGPDPEARPMTILESWRRSAGKFADATLDGIPDPLVRKLMTAYATRWPDTLPETVPPGGVLLGGPTGIRKTGACYALLNHLVADKRVRPNEILIRREEEWLPPLAQVTRFGNAGGAKDTLSTALNGKRILLLDDLGYGRYPSPEDQQSVMLGLLERVERRDILLLVTTNTADPAALRKMIGPAAFSRLWDRVGSEVWVPGEVDTRLGQAHRGTP